MVLRRIHVAGELAGGGHHAGVPALFHHEGAVAQVQALARVVVVGRQGYPGGVGPALPAVSSTEVRERLARGEDVSALVPRRVLEYARERGLYGPR